MNEPIQLREFKMTEFKCNPDGLLKWLGRKGYCQIHVIGKPESDDYMALYDSYNEIDDTFLFYTRQHGELIINANDIECCYSIYTPDGMCIPESDILTCTQIMTWNSQQLFKGHVYYVECVSGEHIGFMVNAILEQITEKELIFRHCIVNDQNEVVTTTFKIKDKDAECYDIYPFKISSDELQNKQIIL